MSIQATVEIIKAFLAKEGLALCKLNDTQFPLDGLKEHEMIREIVEIVEDNERVLEWSDEDSYAKTNPVPANIMQALARQVAA